MSKPNILSRDRQTSFDSPSKLSKEQRNVYFLIDVETRQRLNRFKSNVNKVGYLVQKAYFQEKGRFFDNSMFYKVDINKAKKALGINEDIDLNQYTEQTRLSHKKIILKSFMWSAYTKEHKNILIEKAKELFNEKMPREDILFSLVYLCWEKKIEIPEYNELANLITLSAKDFEIKHIALIEKNISEEDKYTLEEFSKKISSAKNFSKIKKVSQNINYTDLAQNIEHIELYQSYYNRLSSLLNKLNLSDKTIKLFANWIEKATLTQFKQLNLSSKNLHVLCFIKEQYFMRQDYALDAMHKIIRAAVNSSQNKNNKQIIENQNKAIEANKTVVNTAKNSHQVIKLVQQYSLSEELSLAEKNEKIIQLVSTACFGLNRSPISVLSDHRFRD